MKISITYDTAVGMTLDEFVHAVMKYLEIKVGGHRPTKWHFTAKKNKQ